MMHVSGLEGGLCVLLPKPQAVMHIHTRWLDQLPLGSHRDRRSLPFGQLTASARPPNSETLPGIAYTN